jgi:GH24 family phage-related lysozyme (muramidase)
MIFFKLKINKKYCYLFLITFLFFSFNNKYCYSKTIKEKSIKIASEFLMRDDIEGFREKIYFCSAGYKTIGFGTRIFNENIKKITKEKAKKLLILELKKIYDRIYNEVFYKITINNEVFNVRFIDYLDEYQIASLLSMCYNLGFNGVFGYYKLENKKIEISLGFEILYYIINKQKFGIDNSQYLKNVFLSFSKVNGEENNGLKKRREKEFDLFFKKKLDN